MKDLWKYAWRTMRNCQGFSTAHMCWDLGIDHRLAAHVMLEAWRAYQIRQARITRTPTNRRLVQL